MSKLIIEIHAEEDLEALYDADENTAATINVHFEELLSNDRLVALLCQNRVARRENPAFDNERFQELWHNGYTIFRTKIWDFDGALLPYRVLTAYDGRPDCTHVFGILHREYAYDVRHEKVQRCIANYEAIGIYRAK